jgi:hypothetical protein
VRDAAESLPHVVRRLLQLLLHAKRHSVLQLHVCQLPLQVRVHRRRLLHHLHQRRQAMLQYAAMLLRLLLEVLREWLLLLRVLQRHTGLLRHLLSSDCKKRFWEFLTNSQRVNEAPGLQPRGFFYRLRVPQLC